MDVLVALLMPLVCLYALWWLTNEFFPLPTRLITRLLARLWRNLFTVVWRLPMQRLGCLTTLWLWLIGFAGCATVGSCSMMPVAPHATSGLFLCVLMLWALVVLGWYVLRYLARRRYTPRALPTRRRRR